MENTERAKKARRAVARLKKERWAKVNTIKVRHLFQINCMKKFLASLLAAAAFASPVLAEDKVKSWRSFDSVGCMMLRECTEDVTAVQTWEDLGPEYLSRPPSYGDHCRTKQDGAGLFLADEKYFAFGCVVCTTCGRTISF